MSTESIPVRIAKASLRYLMEHGRTLPDYGESLPEELQKPAGVFVSLKKQGQLRGCIGRFCQRKQPRLRRSSEML